MNLIKKVRISYPGGDTGALIKMLSAVLRVDFLLLRKYIVIVDFTPAHCKSQKFDFFFLIQNSLLRLLISLNFLVRVYEWQANCTWS